MITRTDPQPKKPEPPKKLIALVNDGRTTFVNPQWPLVSTCCNCNGRKCVLCSRTGVYRE